MSNEMISTIEYAVLLLSMFFFVIIILHKLSGQQRKVKELCDKLIIKEAIIDILKTDKIFFRSLMDKLGEENEKLKQELKEKQK